MNHRSLRPAARYGVLPSAIAAALVSALVPAIAGAQEADASKNPTTLDRIEVTGSRIRQANLETSQPVVTMDAFPAPVGVLYHEMSHAYNGVNGTFQPGTYRGAGPDNGEVPNAERQAVGLETSAPAYDFDGDPATPKTTANPDWLTENGMPGTWTWVKYSCPESGLPFLVKLSSH